MKTRHAAALTLVGWYLMIPPVKLLPNSDPSLPLGVHSFVVETDAPLGQWLQIDSYDTVASCTDGKLSAIKKNDDAISTMNKSPPAPQDWAKETEALVEVHGALFYARCIGTDDPRLIKGSQHWANPRVNPAPATMPTQ